MSPKEWADIAQSFSVILASLFAIYGIDAWRREFVWKRRVELAEETLSLFYQARDIIDILRSPFSYEGEGTTRKPGPNEKQEHKESLDQAYVLIERYNRHIEVFSSIHTLRYRFMAQFGIKASKPFEDFNRLKNELLLASKRMAWLSTKLERSIQDWEEYDKERREIHRLYYGGGRDDPIAPRLAKIVDEIEQTCRPIIESHRTLFALINIHLGKRRL